MEFENKKIIIASVIVSVMLLFITVAFAALASNLNISFGNVTQNALTWNVGFKGSSVTPTQEGTSNTGLSCGIATVTPSTVTIADSTLSKPDDKCTYPLTIENTGDISANLAAITLSPPTNMTCTKSDESTMECGNITIKLKTKSGLDFSSGVTIEPNEEYDLYLIIQYTGTELNSNEVMLNNSKVSFTYTQSSNRVSAVKPDGIKVAEKVYKCKRATTLHTEECLEGSSEWSQPACVNAGYNGGDTITYGSLGTSGTLTSGDAFDCDVNGDGTYDAEKERFYYVSGLDGDSSSDYATLIYYTNVDAGEPKHSATFWYAPNYSYNGPTVAYLQLPTTTQWPNVSLSNQTRQIYNVNDGTTISNGKYDLPLFTYTDRAARLLSHKEVNAACGITIGNYVVGELDSCEFLMEHSAYSEYSEFDNGTNASSWWLETVENTGSQYAYQLHCSVRYASYDCAGCKKGVRPAIEVLKTDIDY